MDINKSLGTRHRAAVGVSEVTDSLTIVVSEETGHISVAQEGKLKSLKDANDLKRILSDINKSDKINKTNQGISTWRGWLRDAKKMGK